MKKSNSTWPTEEMATAAVEHAAAQKWERIRAGYRDVTEHDMGPWDLADPIMKQRFKQDILALVWDALTSLPDPRYAAWEEGLASADFDFESMEIEATVPNPYAQEG